MITQKTFRLFLACLSTLALTACVTNPSDGKKWTCSAPGLISSYYTGGVTANIHLQGFSTGGTYSVTKNAAGTEAAGVTANGTAFVCKIP